MQDPLEIFAEALEHNVGNWHSAKALFLNVVKSSFLSGFLRQHIQAAADNADHFVPHAVGQSSFTFVDTPHFEYSLRLVSPLAPRAHAVKWLGARQIIMVRTLGTVTVRVLTVPREFDIEKFVPDARIRDVAIGEIRDGEAISSDDTNQILDVHAVTAPTVLEILTYRELPPSLVWTFNAKLLSLYAEQSSLSASRFRNVLALARSENIPIPDDIYDLAVVSNSPQVALFAIESMLSEGHSDAFAALYRATESHNPSLRKGAMELLDALF
jgi:hypothetical protein